MAGQLKRLGVLLGGKGQEALEHVRNGKQRKQLATVQGKGAEAAAGKPSAAKRKAQEAVAVGAAQKKKKPKRLLQAG